jgi:hypothetical protein
MPGLMCKCGNNIKTEEIPSPNPQQLFQHVDGPGRPDFIGRGIATGRNFDITTVPSTSAHLARPSYGDGLQICTYGRPSGFRTF